jgi:hypothetical protein
MARDPHYPAKYSIVCVEMKDTGEVREFKLTASSSLMPYLMNQVGETGALTLLCGDTSYGIPMSQIAQVTMREFSTPEERDAAMEKSA